jgi:RND family efflux transporter MFP subunit
MNFESRIDPLDADALNAAGHGIDASADGSGGFSRKVIIGLLVAAALLAGLAWYLTRDTAATPSAAEQAAAQAQTVSVIVPGRISVQGLITASGVLAARREMPVGIAGEGGKVVRVLVDAGDWVNAGQVLATVDRSVQAQQLSGQSASVAVQAANARIAQSNLDRALKLVEKGFISKADVDRLTATRDAAVAQVQVARATLGQLQASTARLDIVAPAAGLVLTRAVEPGQIVSAGSGVLFRIARDGEQEMQARLAENDLARLTTGVAAEVVPVGSGRTFNGQIWQLSPTIDSQTREGVARIALGYDVALRPGGFASASIRSGTVVAPVLPESAILSDQNGAFVYLVGSDNKVQRRKVQTGDVTKQGIVVLQGLSGNEKIVLRAGGFLNPGDMVRPTTVPLPTVSGR